MVSIYFMKVGIWNLGIGLVGVVLGLSGKFVLPFTTDARWLVGVGAAIAVLGVVQILRSRQG